MVRVLEVPRCRIYWALRSVQNALCVSSLRRGHATVVFAASLRIHFLGFRVSNFAVSGIRVRELISPRLPDLPPPTRCQGRL